ncbi:MAG: hypothetical protein QF918_11900 [Pirellulaceae bacterium]|jgi:hypothetical protein|nr:hypothetical protein [Pirellulaceae bacterium]MDP6554601.1 hypothetical protein [Pirellulaceae bacterium]MDP6720857.1 hypothetical protein [Pirellulaceae bacterium]
MTPLHQFGELLRQSLQTIPLSLVRILFVASLVGLLFWVLRLPQTATTPPAGAKRWDENLKTGAAIALVIQILIYSLL